MGKVKLIRNQIRRFETGIRELKIRSRRFSFYRLGIAIAGMILIIMALYFGNEILSGMAIFTFLVVFNIASYFHRRIARKIHDHTMYRDLKLQHIDRYHLNWKNIPHTEIRPFNQHPFDGDLDITGEYSLHRLMDTSTSRLGGRILSDWLLCTHPKPEDIKHRQKLVGELAELTRFRDKLKLTSYRINEQQFDGEKLTLWLKKSALRILPRWILPLLSILAAVDIILFSLYYLQLIPAVWIFPLILYIILFLSNRIHLNDMFEDALNLSDELKKFSEILIFIEKNSFAGQVSLKQFIKRFYNSGANPSATIKKMNYIIIAIGLRMNPVMQVLLNLIGPWDYYISNILRKYKESLSEILPEWLNTWYELEALSSIATFADLHRDYTFPELISREKASGARVFESTALGHPLIPFGSRITNDFCFENLSEIVLLTGSNMSGKSTFLRTVGINFCLAFAGAPVAASRFRARLFRLYTCIRISDSLNDGISYFYSEVKRLKNLLAESEKPDDLPLLFLIDEIFKGTNNRERLIGSRSYIRALAELHNPGIISTHDLELVELSDEISILKNFHFQEHIEEGRMIFDYKIRTGPCPTTNALKIMELEGLPVNGKNKP